MKGNKILISIVVCIVLAAMLLMSVGCANRSSGKTEVNSVTDRSITIEYSFKNSFIGGLFFEDELVINFCFGKGSGMYTKSGLDPDTDYTFSLKDIGDPSQKILDSITITTKDK